MPGVSGGAAAAENEAVASREDCSSTPTNWHWERASQSLCLSEQWAMLLVAQLAQLAHCAVGSGFFLCSGEERFLQPGHFPSETQEMSAAVAPVLGLQCN